MNKHITKWDTDLWKEVNDKKSLKLYREGKESIKEELIYNNTPASVILYQARTNSLPLEDRKHQEGRIKNVSYLCHEENEDFDHFMMKCNKTEKTRNLIPILQRPHKNKNDEFLGNFLFNTNQDWGDMERRKEWLYKMWKDRRKKLIEMKKEDK